MVKPRIGISMNFHGEDSSASEIERAYLDSPYLDVWSDLGVIPIPIAPLTHTDDIEELMGDWDGVLFTGGRDIDPVLWGEPLHPKTELLHPRRQHYEIILYEKVQKGGLPILGICLGIQLINVAEGGSLYQYIPDEPGRVDHGSEGRTTQHAIELNPNGRLHRWLGGERLIVRSCHHQGVHRVGKGLLASAVAEDGVTEVVEKPDYPFLLAVQWHPERESGDPVNQVILDRFIEAVRAFQSSK